MSKTITRLFDNHTEALSAVEALEAGGVDHEKISLISNNTDNWHGDHEHAGGSVGDMNHDGENDVADGAGKGATTGGLLGGGAGLLAGLGMLAIPGLGPVVAAGWLASTAVGAAIGAAAGGATGGLLGALKEAGHSDEDANVYAEGVRRGGTLVSVKADNDDADRVESLLDGHQGVDAQSRGDSYRAGGWSQFDDAAEPYSSDEIARERETRREVRSFDHDENATVQVEDDREARPANDTSAPKPY